jgi:hypothetical protein
MPSFVPIAALQEKTEGSDSSDLPLMPNYFAKLLESIFSCFAKIRWVPSLYTKLLELL